MPRLLNGKWCAGVGGGIASVGDVRQRNPATGLPVALAQWDNAGGTCWLAPDLALFQHGAHLETFDLRNGEHNEAADSQGAYELAAGGGVYAAKFTDGVRISNQPGVRFSGSGVGDVGPDGDVFLKQPNGTFHNTGRVLVSIQALGNGQWSALDESYRPICSSGVPNVVPVPGRIYGLRRCGPYALYHAEDGGRVIVQVIDRPVGCVVAGGVTAAYRPDLAVVGDRILVTYATSEGEPPESLRLFSIAMAALTETLGPMQTVPPPVETPPEPVPPPTPEPKPMPTIPQDEQDRAQAMLAQVRNEMHFGAGQPDLPYVTLVAQRLGGRWGLNGKRGDANNRSHDILAYRVDGGQPILVDVLGDGGGANTPQFGILEYPQPAGAVWIDPGPPPGPVAQPPVSQPPAVDLSDIIRKLAVLEAKVAVLELKPDPVIPPAPDLRAYAKKGDKVSVSGRAKFFGLNEWGGTIDEDK